MNLDLVKYDFLHWKSCYIQKFGVADKATSTLICESCSVQCRFDISNNLGFVYYLSSIENESSCNHRSIFYWDIHQKSSLI